MNCLQKIQSGLLSVLTRWTNAQLPFPTSSETGFATAATRLFSNKIPAHTAKIYWAAALRQSEFASRKWSRWAMNLVNMPTEAIYAISSTKCFAVFHSPTCFGGIPTHILPTATSTARTACRRIWFLSRIGNGLSEGELMPQKYDYKDSGYSITAVERKMGKGRILCTSLLLGTKYKTEPIAAKILNNLI